ncbi:MAG: nucleotide exchange factor GrpE [Dehalococcoidia bacterium]
MERRRAAEATAERLDRIGVLLEEVADDNITVVASMNRLSQAQEALASDLVRELRALREDLSEGLAYRALKDLCTELIGPLAAMDAMLERADFADPSAVSGHVHSLSVTLRAVLTRMGARRMSIVNGETPFNPNLHRCVRRVAPARSPFPDAAPRTVVRVVADGYLLDERILVAATVEVQDDLISSDAIG